MIPSRVGTSSLQSLLSDPSKVEFDHSFRSHGTQSLSKQWPLSSVPEGASETMGNIAAGATAVVSLDFAVLSGTQAPPNGSLITAVVTDRAHGAFVSSSATVKNYVGPRCWK